MILHTTEITALPGCRLALRFNNGETGEVDLSDELVGDMFAPLLDPILFATARQHPTMKTVARDNGADLAPGYLFDLMRAQQQRVA